MSNKMEMIKKLVASQRKAAEAAKKESAEWEGKTLAEFLVDGEEQRFVMPVLQMTQASKPEVYVTIPSFEGLHHRVVLSTRSYNGQPSEASRYAASDEYKEGIITVYATGDCTQDGNAICKWNGLRAVTSLESVRDVAIQQNAAPRVKSRVVIADQTE